MGLQRNRSLRRTHRAGATGALALVVLAGAAGCTTPACDLEVGADQQARLSGWLDGEDGAGRPAFRVTVDGQEIQRRTADGASREARRLLGSRPEHRFDTTFRLAPGRHEICLRAEGDDRPRFCRHVEVPATGQKPPARHLRPRTRRPPVRRPM